MFVDVFLWIFLFEKVFWYDINVDLFFIFYVLKIVLCFELFVLVSPANSMVDLNKKQIAK